MDLFDDDLMIAEIGELMSINMGSAILDDPMLWGFFVEGTRNQDFYEVVVPMYTLDEFRCHFRMNRSCFSDLMNKIALSRNILNLEKKLLFTIWMVSKQESFLAAGDRFNFCKSVAHRSFCEMLDAICALHNNYISWPNREKYEEIAQKFRDKSGGFIPGVIGAIDGCHIQIKQPVRNPIDYYNRKNTHSLILQAVCDDRTVFTDVHIGAPGRLHDARVFRTSPLCEQMDYLIPPQYHLLGDSAYPLARNLVTPFRNNGHLTEAQSRFNVSHSKARVAIERAFGLLKGRFRRLKYIDTNKPELANKIVCCSVILHNHIQIFGDDDGEIDTEGDVEEVSIPNEEVSSRNRRDAGNTKRNYIIYYIHYFNKKIS